MFLLRWRLPAAYPTSSTLESIGRWTAYLIFGYTRIYLLWYAKDRLFLINKRRILRDYLVCVAIVTIGNTNSIFASSLRQIMA